MNAKHHILENFIQHSSTIPHETEGMDVVTIGNLVVVDSGLPCDTFNTIHVTGTFSSKELAQAIELFRTRNFPFCCWVNDDFVNDRTVKTFEQSGLQIQAEETGMIMELSRYAPISSKQHPYIKQAVNDSMIRDFSQVIAAHWDPPDQEVLKFYEMTSQQFLDKRARISLHMYYQQNNPVATVEVFASDDHVIGIHGLATLEDTRGQGIGSALMTKVLNEAQMAGYRWAVLLATKDGAGIYERLGFESITTYYEFA